MKIIDDIEKNIIGLTCSKARIGYADVLKLSLGEKIFYENPKLKNQFYGEIDVSIETFSWRLVNETIIECGSADNYKNVENGLKKIIGKKIKKIISENNNFQLIFENDYKLEAFKSTVKNDDLILIDIENKKTNENYSFDGLVWKEYENLGLSDNEIKLDEFSEITNERWKLKVPKIGDKDFCENCAYFLEISGRFYFSDYGICSNKKTDFDGKIVNVRSTCGNYTIELEKDE